MSSNIEDILAEIRADVSAKRVAGRYPPGLEHQLEEQFRSILSAGHRGTTDRYAEISRLANELHTAVAEVSGLTPVSSRIPGVGLLHRVIRRLIARQTMGLAMQVREVERLVSDILSLLIEQGRMFEDADVSMAANLSNHVVNRLAVVDHLAILSTELEARIRKLEEVDE